MDGFGFGIEDKSPAVRQHEIMVKDHINAWNRLVENKSPLGIQQDDLNWQPRFEQLMGDDSFRNFLKSDTVKDKITILRDSGLGPNKEMSDQDLSQFLMTHVPSGLTEDPNVSEEAKSMLKNVNDMNESEYMQFLNQNKTPMNVTKGDLEKLHNSTIK